MKIAFFVVFLNRGELLIFNNGNPDKICGYKPDEVWIFGSPSTQHQSDILHTALHSAVHLPPEKLHRVPAKETACITG